MLADVYSLGVVAFELWHPFETGALLEHLSTEAGAVMREEVKSTRACMSAGMERAVLLADLQSSGALPANWEAAQPQVFSFGQQRRPAWRECACAMQWCAVSESDAVWHRRRAWCAG